LAKLTHGIEEEENHDQEEEEKVDGEHDTADV